MRHMLNLGLAAVVLLGAATTAQSATWNVNPGGGGDALTIQAGINLASNGDVVVVAAGTYSGAGNVNVNFNGKNITVMSASGPFFTIIDCADAARGFIMQSGEGTGAVLEGFTIKHGLAVKGGAVYVDDSSPTIRFCVFYDNVATTSGGAVHLKKGAPVVYNNTFIGNSAPAGGGMWVQGPGSPQVYQNIIANSVTGGAFACAGALSAFVACNNTFANVGGDAICVGNNGSNFSQDPLFCSFAGGNFFVQETSPCTADYSPCLAAVGALGIQCQVTATEHHSWGAVKSLYR